jgi:hypothetical protein
MSDWIPLSAPEHGLEKWPLLIIEVRVIGPTGLNEDTRAFVDTGSDISVLPTHLLEAIGVDFSQAHPMQAVVGGGSATYKVGDPDMIDCQFDGHLAAIAAIASDGAEDMMLGVNDFLRHFDLTVNKLNNQFRLDPAKPGCCNNLNLPPL